MHFTKNKIESKIYYIIDIGSYKLRASSVRLHNKRIEILEYIEKRQDASYFINNECTNFAGLYENISDLISKFSQKSREGSPEIIFTYPFGEIFIKTKTLNYKRSYPHKDISAEELESIIESTQKLCLKKVSSEIWEDYGRNLADMHIILSKIWHIKIDTQTTRRVLWKQWELLNIRLQNIFIPREKYDSLMSIWNTLGTKIYKIIPNEYCMSHIFSQQNLCIIDVGASTTSICVKKDNEAGLLTKIPIGIGHLIDKIKNTTSYSRSQIIESLDNEKLFLHEKSFFIKAWQRSVGVALSELLKGEICTHNFFIYGGWHHNTFIWDALLELDSSKFDLKITKKITLIDEDMWEILSHIEHISLEDIKKIPLHMFALIRETKNILQKEGDIISSSLESALHRLWY